MLALLQALHLAAAPATFDSSPADPEQGAIAWSEIGTRATQDAAGVLVVQPSESGRGAVLETPFQKLRAQVEPETGLILYSTHSKYKAPLRLSAHALGRVDGQMEFLSGEGIVRIDDSKVRWERSAITEEFSVDVDGLRQDFLLAERPAGIGELKLELAVAGAEVSQGRYGVLLKTGDGRRLAYNRLLVLDAKGSEMPARMQVSADNTLTVLVADFDAVYPLRIDPTFSDEQWTSMGGAAGVAGSNRMINALAVAKNGDIYVGGRFSVAGQVLASNIARWDGSSWTALGDGTNGAVLALAIADDGTVYAGGEFTSAGNQAAQYLAKWDGSSWSPFPMELNSSVQALVSGADKNLYVGGNFTLAGGETANRVARWDGSNWHAVGTGMNSTVFALTMDSNGTLYAGGEFTQADGVTANRIAQWTGSAWTAVGAGVNGRVTSFAADDAGGVFAGGWFTTAGAVSANRVAHWNGATWSSLGAGLDNWVQALVFFNATGHLYAGGGFANAGGAKAWRIARWDGSTWSALPDERLDVVYALGIDTAGRIVSADPNPRSWDGAQWNNLGSGIDAQVNDVLTDGKGNLYVAGNFTEIGGAAAKSVARWDGQVWSALSEGLEWSVSDLAIDKLGNLYAVQGVEVLRWGGSSWSVVGSGNGTIVDMAVAPDGTLYIAGAFTTFNGLSASRIARWNGASWSTLGSGLNDSVYTLAFDIDGNLLVGGSFSTAGGAPASRLAKWNGSGWSDMGVSGSYVLSIAVDTANNIYSAYTQSGFYSSSHYVAKWNGTGWSNILTGNAAAVLTTDSAGNLYAAGSFTEVGNRIARWDGSSWSAMGSGLDGGGAALTLSLDNTGKLFVGGTFGTAGGKASPYLAMADVTVRVVYDGNGHTAGSVPVDQNAYVTGSTVTVADATGLERNGYDFIGWNVEASGNSTNYSPGNTFDIGLNGMMLYANWAVKTFAVTASAGQGGSISPASQTVEYGQTASLTITPDTGYSIASVIGCGGSLVGNTYTTALVTADCEVSATFALDSYTVSATAGSGGSITPTSQSVDHGSTASFTVTPAVGYSLVDVSGCGGTLVGDTFTTATITGDCAVQASFTINVYTVTASATGNGSIDPPSTSVEHGSSAVFTVTPLEGYTAVMGGSCGGSLSGSSFTSSAVTGDCTVTAQFEPIFSMDDGSGNQFGDQQLESGGSVDFQLSNGSGDYEVMTLPTANNSTGMVVDNGNGSYSFQAPATGAFAGDYTIVIKDRVSGWTEQVVISVPLKIELSRSTLLGRGERNHAEVTVTGSAPGAVIELSTAGAQTGFLPIAEGELLLSVDNAAEGNPAVGAVVAQDHTEIVSFQVLATASGYPQGSSVQAQVIPAVTYSGSITNAVGGAVSALAELRVTIDRVTEDLVDELGVVFEVAANTEGAFTLVGPADGGDYSLRFSAPGYAASNVAAASCPESNPCIIMLDYESTVADPELSPAGGSFTGSVDVTLSTTTAEATLVYTRDGSTPSRSNGEQLQSGATITLEGSATLKVFAFKDGLNDSAVISADYTIAAAPAPAPVSGSSRSGGGGSLDWILLGLLGLAGLARRLSLRRVSVVS